jgi:peptidoglycan/LPS O-acetylase OafA/YrhL
VSTADPPRFAHQPALDGVRGVAVALVLLFHQGWMSGGYVGVSVFFTLSGYLITSLALAEHDATRRLDVRAFYGRRVRRLLPASLACLLGIALLAWSGVFDDVEHLRRDLWAALIQVYNWIALSGDQSYSQLVGTAGAASPLDHYWSLAIEEQFYWVWPLALVVILRRPARGRIVLVAAVTGVAALSAPIIARLFGPDAAYWATPARLGEILAGALLAVILHARRTARPLPAAAAGLAGGGLAAVGCAAVLWPSGSGPAFTGWLPLFALASVALIAGLQVPSVLQRGLSWQPLVALGAISYGVYLFHWPVYVVLDETRTDLPAVPLFAARIAVTLALSVLSYRLLERPVRAARPRPRTVGVGALSACAAVGLVVAMVPAAARPYWMVDAGEADPTDAAATAAPPSSEPVTAAAPRVVAPTTTAPGTPSTTAAPATTRPAAPPAAVPPSTAAASVLAATGTAAPVTVPPSTVPVAPPMPPIPEAPVRVLVVGDSTAMATATGLVNWAKLNPAYIKVTSAASVGCGFIPEGSPRADIGGKFARQCAKVRARLPAKQASAHPDVIVGMVTMTDEDDRLWDEAEGWIGGPADPRFRERLGAAYDAASVAFLEGGARKVLWIAPPVSRVPFPAEDQHLLDPTRYEAYAAALRDVAARHPGQVAVVELAAWISAQPAPPDRPDGLHWSRSASFQLAEAFLGPVIVSAALS